MPDKISKDDLDSFLKSHLKSVPERELSDNDEKEMISNIILKTIQNRTKQNVASMTWTHAKELSRNVYDNFRIGKFQVLSPQFGLPLLLIIAVSVFLVIKYTGTHEKKDVIITEKQKLTNKGNQIHFKSNENNKHELAILDNENHIQSMKLESISLIYSDRGSKIVSIISDNTLENINLLIKDVLKENGIKSEQIDNKIVSEWLLNTGSIKNDNLQSRLIININKKKSEIELKIEQKPTENKTNKKKNFKLIYKKIDAEIYKLIKFSK